MKQFTEKEIEEALKKTPKLVQDEIVSGEDMAVLIGQIGKKYKLHIEQVGALAELLRNMLVGLIKSEEFIKDLVSVGVSDGDAKAVLSEADRQIFAPLRENIKKEGLAVAPAEQKVAASAAAAPKPAQQARVVHVNAPLPSYGAPPLQSPRYTRAEFTKDSASAPLPPKTAMPVPRSLDGVGPRPAVASSTTATPAPTPASMQSTAAPRPPAPQQVSKMPPMLPIGEEEVVAPAAPAPVPAPVTPPPPTPMPAPAPPAPALPPTAPEPLVPATPPVAPTELKTPPVPVRPPTAPDPYREPLEGA